MTEPVSSAPFASVRPPIEFEADSPRDILREIFADDQGPLQFTRQSLRERDFRLIDHALTLISGEFPEGSELAAFGAKASGVSTQDVVIKFLRVFRFAASEDIRLDALCVLRIIGEEGRTLEEIGVEAGLGPNKKGTVHKRYREIQRALNDLPGRGDKSPAARRTYRRLRTGKRRQRIAWSGEKIWNMETAA